MAKFDLVSDLHFGFLPMITKGEQFPSWVSPQHYIESLFKPTDASTLLVAGDTFESLGSPNPIVSCFFGAARRNYENVVCVLGNHDYWSRDTYFPDMIEKVRRLYPGVLFLENDVVRIDGVNIFGATFWSPIGPGNEVPVIQSLNDFWNIKTGPDQSLVPEFLNKESEKSKAALKEFLKEHKGGKKLVLTHHAPSTSCNTKYPHSAIEDAFCNRLDDIIMDSNIHTWAYGHIHDAADFKIGETRIVANPHGYLGRDQSLSNGYSFKRLEV